MENYFSPFFFLLKIMTEKTLRLFNSVLITESNNEITDSLSDLTIPNGFIFHPGITSMSNIEEIFNLCVESRLSGDQLNKTFHKSWGIIEESSESFLVLQRIMHYITTYGFKECGMFSPSTVYIPNEVLEIPELGDLPLRLIKGLNKDELISKCLDLLKSGIALKYDTIDDILFILNELNYEFEAVDEIKNKEAKLKIYDKFGLLPTNNSEFIRLLFYKILGTTLVISDKTTLSLLIMNGIDVSELCEKYGLEKLSESFLRYKKIFISIKKGHPNNIKLVNKLRKLAKVHHKPMPIDYLNNFVSLKEFTKLQTIEELDKVNNFRKIRLLYALHNRMLVNNVSMYQIRNGKTYVTEREVGSEPTDLKEKYNIVYEHLINSLDLNGVKVKYSNIINYALPTSEKQFVGNIPCGSSIDVDNNFIVGIYWHLDGGANDMDLSAIGVKKIGWNANSKDDNILFSGDITVSSNGATECLYIKETIDEPYLVLNNIYNGKINSKFKLFVAQEKMVKLEKNHIVDPNNVIIEINSVMESGQKVIGMLSPRVDEGGVRFIFVNQNSGGGMVSRDNEVVDNTKSFLFRTNENPIQLKQVLIDAGCEFVEEGADIDLTLDGLDKSTIMDLFKIESTVGVE